MVSTGNPFIPKVELSEIQKAYTRLAKYFRPSPLHFNDGLSQEYGCGVYLKREDLQRVRSYKIRGAFNKMKSCDPDDLKRGVVCASAGNHAQGVAMACQILEVPGSIFMPATTPSQKIKKVKYFGGDLVTIKIVGDTFDESFQEATAYAESRDLTFVHPFNDMKVIEGQATTGIEILQQIDKPIDILFIPIGGGGLAAGLGSYIKQMSPDTRIIGVEPTGAPAMHAAFKAGEVVELQKMDPFVDGAAVKQVGELNFQICKEVVDEIALVDEGQICQTILQLYNEEAIVVEPAGALTLAVLEQYREEIKGKKIVCLVSGGNNDITRTPEIKERALLYQGLKHYFIIRFPQRAGALRDFVNKVLGPKDDITHFEYTKKHNRESGPALVGIVLKNPEDYQGLLTRMKAEEVQFKEINRDEMLFGLLV
ncbi:MAG: threonine ammonia-lyase IlvA [Saprospiraceae bacterium]|nr:threonine ammonia-lyase IlvA [Saprospiraceae bacterium]